MKTINRDEFTVACREFVRELERTMPDKDIEGVEAALELLNRRIWGPRKP